MSETKFALPLASSVEAARVRASPLERCTALHASTVQLAVASITSEGGMPLVYGPDGSGKARVASEIERALANTHAMRAFAVYRVDASSLARTKGALLGAIANRLDVRLPREVWVRLAAIEKRGLELAARKVVPVVFVTNAERLNAGGLDDVNAVWDLVLPSGSCSFGKPACKDTRSVLSRNDGSRASDLAQSNPHLPAQTTREAPRPSHKTGESA